MDELESIAIRKGAKHRAFPWQISREIPEEAKMTAALESHGDLTLLLAKIREGEDEAITELADVVYEQLHLMAQRLMDQETVSHTLQPTALLNEAFLRLLGDRAFQRILNGPSFFATASRAMRYLLIEYARRRKALKRGREMRRLALDSLVAQFESRTIDLEALNEGLDALSSLHERAAQVVTLRFFGGFTQMKVARQLGVSVSTVEADYRFARAWLRDRLNDG